MDFLNIAEVVLPKLFVAFFFFTVVFVSVRGFANKNKEADMTAAQRDSIRAKELEKEFAEEAEKEETKG